MPGVFLSYRREDAAGHAGRLYDRLKRHLGKHGVFRDKELIQPGGDFRKILHHQLSGADLVIAIIGCRWLDTLKQRAADATASPDWVVTELTMALDWKIPIIPVLVDGASMPGAEHLPHDLKQLSNLQARALEDSDGAITAFVRELPRIVPTLPQRRSWAFRLGATIGNLRVSIGASIIIGSIALFLLLPTDHDAVKDGASRTSPEARSSGPSAGVGPPSPLPEHERRPRANETPYRADALIGLSRIRIVGVKFDELLQVCPFVEAKCEGLVACKFRAGPCRKEYPAPRVTRRMQVSFNCQSENGRLGPLNEATALEGEWIEVSCDPAIGMPPSDTDPTRRAAPPPPRPRGRF